jgi:hypothetical protein
MTRVRPDIAQPGVIGSLPAGKRTTYYHIGPGISLAITPEGVRRFDVTLPVITEEGLVKSARRTLGYWPTLSAVEAREQGKYYRALAAEGIDARQVQLQKAWRAELRTKKKAAKQIADPAAREQALARLARQERNFPKALAKQTAQALRPTPPPKQRESGQALTMQEVLTLPWRQT